MQKLYERSKQKMIMVVAGTLLFIPVLASAATPSHAPLKYEGRGTCLPCHSTQAQDMHGSVHYQWQGAALRMTNTPSAQGKNAGAMNAYCINITGNWNGCAVCHVGGGAKPEAQISQAQLENIDCLMCHSDSYKRRRNATGLFEPMTSAMSVKSMDTVVQQVAKPTRVSCLQCHAKAAGGDAFKRGDLALASGTTTDRNYDVHMAKTTTGNIQCTQCHDFRGHKVAGQGADLYPTDKDIRPTCSTTACHSNKVTLNAGHATTDINKHMKRIACQVCHIPVYAKNATDTTATEATEIFRDWSLPNYLVDEKKWHPTSTYANNQKPVYLFWNGKQRGYNVGDQAIVDPATGVVAITRPAGNNQDGVLTAFKYKTANQPYLPTRNQMLALNTGIYAKTGDLQASILSGLTNMGYAADELVTWVKTDTYQALNHQVSPKAKALTCASCHPSATATQMKLNTMGYTLKAPYTTVCKQCHSTKNPASYSYTTIHSKHVTSMKYDCSFCHSFTRATERGLRTTK